ncbi:unnamed protein product, partial [Brenthis ino]
MTEVGDLCHIWGNLPLMTGTAFILLTNLAQVLKCLNIVARRRTIIKIITDGSKDLSEEKSIEGRSIIESFNQETRQHQLCFFVITFLTAIGWAGSAEKNKFPLRAWYPYNANKSPAYELTYVHQVFSIFTVSILNVSQDTLVTTLIAQCRCRLRLVGLSLRNSFNDQYFTEESTSDTILLKSDSNPLHFTPDQETKARKHIKSCAIRHQKALETVLLLQNTFSEPTFVQFAVTLLIICATAFQLVTQTSNFVRLVSMSTYLLDMMFQVFIYCYQGEHLSLESEEIAEAAYDIPWYSCSVRTRMSILIVMVRCRRVATLIACAFTTLSLTTFMAVRS